MTTQPDRDWPYQLTAHFTTPRGQLENRQVLVEYDSYIRLIKLLTTEQHAEFRKLAETGDFSAISVRVTTIDDAPLL